MKQLVKVACLFLMFGIYIQSATEAAASQNSGSNTAITLEGWGDIPEPNPGIEGPQSESNGSLQEVAKSPVRDGKLPPMNEKLEVMLQFLGIMLLLLVLFLVWLLYKRFKKSDIQYNLSGGEED